MKRSVIRICGARIFLDSHLCGEICWYGFEPPHFKNYFLLVIIYHLYNPPTRIQIKTRGHIFGELQRRAYLVARSM